MNRCKVAVVAVAGSMLLVSCAGDSERSDGKNPPSSESTELERRTTAKSGWIDGSPADADATSGGRADGYSYSAIDAAPTDEGSAEPSSASASEKPMPAETEVSSTIADPGFPVPPTNEALRAGSVDDNVKFEEYLLYRQEMLAAGIAVHDIDPNGRYRFEVRDAADRTVLGAKIAVTDSEGAVVAQVATHADGTAVAFLPVATDAQQQSAYVAKVTSGSLNAEAKLGGERTVRLVLDGEVAAPAPQLDVLFAIDATGSMGDEIEQLKANMVKVSEAVAAAHPETSLRFGMTVFRDEGDAFVTKSFQFTEDVPGFVTALREVEANGGGDTPEAVSQAIAEALSGPTWRGADTVKLVFLIGDAAPHIDASPDYVESIRKAASLGIKIHPIASSGLDNQGEFIFRQFALVTGGRFNFLTYGASGAGTPGDTTTHHVDDFSVLSLDELVVALINKELTNTAASPG